MARMGDKNVPAHTGCIYR